MIHNIISTPRTGSTSLAENICNKYSAVQLGELFDDAKVLSATPFEKNEKCEQVIEEIINTSEYCNVVVKSHIRDLTEVYTDSNGVIENFLSKCKLYYSVRTDHASQVLSLIAASMTEKWDSRPPNNYNKLVPVYLDEDMILARSNRLLNYIAVQGELYKKFPGELCILEKWGTDPYYPCYDFLYESKSIQKYLEQDFNILSYFR